MPDFCRVNMPEFHTVAQGTFDKADKNKDGKLDMSEWDNAEEHGFHIEM